jgi:hypothetical protein
MAGMTLLLLIWVAQVILVLPFMLRSVLRPPIGLGEDATAAR